MNRAAFASLVRDCHAEAYRAALAMCGHADQAADVVQEVYLDVLAGRIDLTGADRPCGLIRWYAIRRALMSHRAATTRKTKENAMPVSMDEDGGPLALAAAGERDELLWRELLALPDDLRRPLVLRFREELSLARIGELLGLPLQTVHDRIGRALERLRPRLQAQGFGAVLVPELLKACPGPVLPGGLEVTLLGFGKKATLALTAKFLGAAVVVVAMGLGVRHFVAEEASDPLRGGEASFAIAGERAHNDPMRSETRPRDDLGRGEGSSIPNDQEERPEPKAAPAIPAPRRSEAMVTAATTTQVSPELSTGRLRGRVLDQSDRPVAGALVTASSLENLGKMPRYSAAVRSGIDGTFEVEVPVGAEDSRDYRLWIRLEDHEPMTARRFAVRASGSTDTGDHLLRHLGAAPSAKLELTMLGPDGKVVEGVLVEVMRLQPSPGEEPRPEPGANGLSDPAGRIQMIPRSHGPHRVRIDGRRRGFGVQLLDIDLPARGLVERSLTLESARSLSIRVVDGEGRKPLGLSIRVRDPRDPNAWLSAVLDGDSFVVNGLGRGPYEVWNDDGIWSSFRLTEVVPSAGGIDLVVKRLEDRRDIGRHLGEVHFRAQDGRSGAVVPLDDFAVDVYMVTDRPDGALMADRAPWLLADPMSQRCEIDRESVDLPPVPGSEGMRHCDGLEPGVHLVVIRCPGYARKVLGPFRVRDDEIFVLDQVVLQPERTIEGQVLDQAGKPVPRATVVPGGQGEYSETEASRIATLLVEERASQRILVPGSVTTDGDGRFRVTAIADDLPFVLRAFDTRGRRADSQLINPGEASPLRMIMQP